MSHAIESYFTLSFGWSGVHEDFALKPVKSTLHFIQIICRFVPLSNTSVINNFWCGKIKA